MQHWTKRPFCNRMNRTKGTRGFPTKALFKLYKMQILYNKGHKKRKPKKNMWRRVHFMPSLNIFGKKLYKVRKICYNIITLFLLLFLHFFSPCTCGELLHHLLSGALVYFFPKQVLPPRKVFGRLV